MALPLWLGEHVLVDRPAECGELALHACRRYPWIGAFLSSEAHTPIG